MSNHSSSALGHGLNPLLTTGDEGGSAPCGYITQAAHTALGSNKELYQPRINKEPKHCIEPLCAHVPVDHSLHSQEPRLDTYKWCPNLSPPCCQVNPNPLIKHGTVLQTMPALSCWTMLNKAFPSDAHHHTPRQKHYRHLQPMYGAQHSSCLLIDDMSSTTQPFLSGTPRHAPQAVPASRRRRGFSHVCSPRTQPALRHRQQKQDSRTIIVPISAAQGGLCCAPQTCGGAANTCTQSTRIECNCIRKHNLT